MIKRENPPLSEYRAFDRDYQTKLRQRWCDHLVLADSYQAMYGRAAPGTPCIKCGAAT